MSLFLSLPWEVGLWRVVADARTVAEAITVAEADATTFAGRTRADAAKNTLG